MNKSVFFILALALSVASTALAQNTDRTRFGVGVGYRSRTVDLDLTQLTPSLASLDEDLLALDVELDYSMPILALEMGFLQYIDLRLLIGMMDYDVDHTSSVEGLSHTITSDSESMYGFGGRFMLPFHETYHIGVLFEHFRGEFDSVEFSGAEPTMNITFDSGRTLAVDSTTLDNWVYHETTITPIVAATFGKFMPYAGPRFTRITSDLDFTYIILGEELERAGNYEVSEDWSLVLGLTAYFNENLSVNVEVETLNNESYTLGVTYTF